MPKVSAKRQITLPKDQCKLAGIAAGGEYLSYVNDDGYITIVRKVVGAAKGILNGIDADETYDDDQSLHSSIS